MSYPVFMVPAGDVLPVMFATYAGSTGASVTLTGLAVTDIEIYKDGSVTQRASDAGYTLLDTDGIDFDGTTGIHGFSIDTGDNTDASFYTVGAWFTVVVSAVTVDSQTVSFIACQFRIMEAETTAGRPLTQTAAISANAITATSINADAITAAKIADGAIDAATFAAGAINAAAIAADAITDAKVASDVTIASVTGAVGSVTGNVGGNVTGSVGSVAAGGIAAASFAAGAIDASAIAASAIGASEIANDAITAAKIADGAIDAATFAAGAIDAAATANDFLAEVNAEVVDALNTDTYAEPGQGTPAATASLVAKIGYLYKAWRNKHTQTASEYALYADDGTTKDQEAGVADDGTTFTRNEMQTGA
jgi:hypothetical protein